MVCYQRPGRLRVPGSVLAVPSATLDPVRLQMLFSGSAGASLRVTAPGALMTTRTTAVFTPTSSPHLTKLSQTLRTHRIFAWSSSRTIPIFILEFPFQIYVYMKCIQRIHVVYICSVYMYMYLLKSTFEWLILGWTHRDRSRFSWFGCRCTMRLILQEFVPESVQNSL